APKEIAYFVAPVVAGGPPNGAYSSASFVPERKEIWYSDSDRGLYVLRVTNGAWGGTVVAPATAPRPVKPPVAAPPPAPGQLPATGLPWGLPVVALLLLTAVVGARRTRRT
ncbi:MAG: hypothetical protein JWP11_3345, partial [Frankiales bacterium]|nr:hypothetical protein [Frankiales bacterium]